MASPKRKPVAKRRDPAAAGREKVRAYRQRLREQGLRPVQVWVPDTRTEAFRKEARRQSRAVARHALEREDQGWVDSASAWGDA